MIGHNRLINSNLNNFSHDTVRVFKRFVDIIIIIIITIIIIIIITIIIISFWIFAGLE